MPSVDMSTFYAYKTDSDYRIDQEDHKRYKDGYVLLYPVSYASGYWVACFAKPMETLVYEES